MLSHHYPGLFDDDPAMKARAENLAGRSYELMAFLVDVLGVTKVAARYDGAVTYHDSCSGLRELGVKAQPRQLLARCRARLSEMRRPRSAAASAARSASSIPRSPMPWSARNRPTVAASGADTVLAGDLGCPAEHGGQAAAPRAAGARAPRRRGAGRHGRSRADRRA
jgi:L-lactate dehydrogenase complex protein LldE